MSRLVIYHHKRIFLTDRDYVIKIEMKLTKYLLKGYRPEYPDSYKFSWIAFNQDNLEQKVLFDNHHNKFPHFHINNDQEVFFKWLSLEQAESLFFQKVQEQFGNFNYF